MKKSIVLSIALLTCTFQAFANPASGVARAFFSSKTKFAGAAMTLVGLVYYGEYTCSKSTHHKEVDALFGVVQRAAGLIKGWAKWAEDASINGRNDLAEAEAQQAAAILAKAKETRQDEASAPEPTPVDTSVLGGETPPADNTNSQ